MAEWLGLLCAPGVYDVIYQVPVVACGVGQPDLAPSSHSQRRHAHRPACQVVLALD